MKRLYSLSLIVFVACGGGGEGGELSTDASTGSDSAAPSDAAPDAMPEPTPPFKVAPFLNGSLAVDADGLRETFRIGATTYYSNVALSLRAEGTDTDCGVWLRPKFVAFDAGSSTGRSFKTLLLDPAASTILDDQCGWDDAHILSGLAAIGVIEIGLARARFAEDRPYLDVFYDGDSWLPSGTASIVYAGRGTGSAMTADGVVDEASRVEPTAGTLDRALYDF